ncbi:FAD:protein FMN transferase [Simkania negevensis]|uniref:FAD:protein FMN transferase n=1 Tax=Simkania negevensis TaxID=83561 RepID=A0ABS3APL8_9BACT|nr:FAD:protein FMN transferase [Simkania negevensis]
MKNISSRRKVLFLVSLSAFLCALCAFAFHSAASLPSRYEVFSDIAMTVPYRILVADLRTNRQKERVAKIIQSTFNEVDTIFNNWNPRSELSAFNNAPPDTPFPLSPPLFELLHFTDKVVTLTEGRFDPTVAPLQKVWKQALQRGSFPDKILAEQTAKRVGWHQIILEDTTARKRVDGVELDLCGIAKGWCVDMISERLKEEGFSNSYVEWGGGDPYPR